MAQINFPVATVAGQIFEADTGVLYTYVGTPPNGYWSGTFGTDGTDTLDARYVKKQDGGVTQTIASTGLKINNNSTDTIVLSGNGSATFASDVILAGGGGATAALQKQEVESLISAIPSPGNGSLTIKTAGEGANSTGSYSANQSGNSTLTLPTIRYGDLSGRPSIPSPANNGTITIVQPGTSDQSFTVNQSGNKTITLKNDNTQNSVGNGEINVNAGTGLSVSGTNAKANQSGNTTRTLSLNTTYTDGRYVLETGDNMSGNLTFNTNKIVLNTNGNATFAGSITASGNVTAYSDINLKEDIQTIPNALGKISLIRGVTYIRNDIELPRQAGVIAQEVEQVLPEVVTTDKDGIKSVAYGPLAGLLIEAIKELQLEIQELKGGKN